MTSTRSTDPGLLDVLAMAATASVLAAVIAIGIDGRTTRAPGTASSRWRAAAPSTWN